VDIRRVRVSTGWRGCAPDERPSFAPFSRCRRCNRGWECVGIRDRLSTAWLRPTTIRRRRRFTLAENVGLLGFAAHRRHDSRQTTNRGKPVPLSRSGQPDGPALRSRSQAVRSSRRSKALELDAFDHIGGGRLVVDRDAEPGQPRPAPWWRAETIDKRPRPHLLTFRLFGQTAVSFCGTNRKSWTDCTHPPPSHRSIMVGRDDWAVYGRLSFFSSRGSALARPAHPDRERATRS